MTALHALAAAYQAIPAGQPTDAEVIERLPALYGAIDQVLSEATRIEGLLAVVANAEREGLTVHVATHETCEKHLDVAAGVERVYLRDDSSGRWHIGLVEGDSEPMLHDGCNVEGTREYFHEMPADVPPEMLCKRCFG